MPGAPGGGSAFVNWTEDVFCFICFIPFSDRACVVYGRLLRAVRPCPFECSFRTDVSSYLLESLPRADVSYASCKKLTSICVLFAAPHAALGLITLPVADAAAI
jgi:hypothetical protein